LATDRCSWQAARPVSAAAAAPLLKPMDIDDAISLLRVHERRRCEAARGVGPGGRVRARRAGPPQGEGK
jgi:hypothetical protein